MIALTNNIAEIILLNIILKELLNKYINKDITVKINGLAKAIENGKKHTSLINFLIKLQSKGFLRRTRRGPRGSAEAKFRILIHDTCA